MKDIRKNFCTVQGWMVQDLNLSGSELLAYALVFGFCQNTESKFVGSIDYIQTWLNVGSRNTVIKTMSSLVDKNLLIKKQNVFNGVTFNEYDINFDKIKECTTSAENEGVVQKMNYGSAKNELGGSAKNELGGSAFFAPNNIEDKIIKKDKNTYRAFAHLSLSFSEFEKLKELGYSENQINTILDDIENYKKNTSYKSLFLTAKKWLAKEPKLIQQQNKQEEPKKAPSVFKYV